MAKQIAKIRVILETPFLNFKVIFRLIFCSLEIIAEIYLVIKEALRRFLVHLTLLNFRTFLHIVLINHQISI
jgi:hypothetical protein